MLNGLGSEDYCCDNEDRPQRLGQRGRTPARGRRFDRHDRGGDQTLRLPTPSEVASRYVSGTIATEGHVDDDGYPWAASGSRKQLQRNEERIPRRAEDEEGVIERELLGQVHAQAPILRAVPTAHHQGLVGTGNEDQEIQDPRHDREEQDGRQRVFGGKLPYPQQPVIPRFRFSSL